MDKPMSWDLLSNLPLGIIHIILSFLPIRDAIGTSFLSRQWRYIWSSLPQLAFVENSDSDQRMPMYFINQALLLHQGPIHKFELRVPSVRETQWIDHWLLFLSRNDIRILDVYSYDVRVHSSLYSCEKLTHLKLRVSSVAPLPSSFKGFMFLRSLCITVGEVSPGTIETIVAHSPLLEELTIDRCPHSLMTTICAPNLKYFCFKSATSHLSLCAPLLEEFKGRLSGTKHFSIGTESLVFHHLRTIELSYVPYVKEVAKAVIQLIRSSPNLQKLELSFTQYIPWEDAQKLAFEPFWNIKSAPDFTYNSLKVLKISYGSTIYLMNLIRFLLARSPLLERLISEQELMNLRPGMSYRWASGSAEIVIDRKGFPIGFFLSDFIADD